jgi:DnaJ-class molecular chaperone
VKKSSAQNPYEVLGVARDASSDEIRAAYRRLAKKHHPDLNPGNKVAEEKFKAVSGAYAILGDEDKRRRFDRGEIDASGQEQTPQGFYSQHAAGSAGRRYGPFTGQGAPHQAGQGFENFADLNDLFGDLFGQAARGQTAAGGFRTRGGDVEYTLAIDFLDVVNGAKRRLTLPDGSTLDVNIPPGVKDGQALRLAGKGHPGLGTGPAGDAYVHITIRAHPFYRRDGQDLHVELPVTLSEALNGAKLRVPTPTGSVTLSVPPASNSGSKLRLKGKGVADRGGVRGDLLFMLKVILPDAKNAELNEFMARWEKAHPYNPRGELEKG